VYGPNAPGSCVQADGKWGPCKKEAKEGEGAVGGPASVIFSISSVDRSNRNSLPCINLLAEQGS
jgi:hypothetical protein